MGKRHWKTVIASVSRSNLVLLNFTLKIASRSARNDILHGARELQAPTGLLRAALAMTFCTPRANYSHPRDCFAQRSQ
jgi:hypothetical protein